MHGTHGSLFIADDKCHSAFVFLAGEYTMRVCVVYSLSAREPPNVQQNK